MKIVARSVNNDIFLYAGQFAMADGRIAQGQIIEAAILTVKGELQFNSNQGIPYFDTIFDSPKKAYLWKAHVKKRIMEFSWVTGITQFDYEFDYKNHVIEYTLRVVTDLGTVTIKSIDYYVSTIGTHTGGGGGGMENLIQNGIFYLPVFKENNIQVYRQLTQYYDSSMGGVTTELSEKTYVKNSDDVFIERI